MTSVGSAARDGNGLGRRRILALSVVTIPPLWSGTSSARSSSSQPSAWRTFLLEADDSYLRTVPAPGIFSPMQYGAHVRDILRVYGDRILIMLEEEDPVFPQFNPDEGVWDGYNRLGRRNWLMTSGRRPSASPPFSMGWNRSNGRSPWSGTAAQTVSTRSRWPVWPAMRCTRRIIICWTPTGALPPAITPALS